MTSIYDLSWNNTSFLAKLQLFFKSRKREKEKMQSNNQKVRVEGYSALSSTYYNIVGTAFSQLKTSLQPKLFAPVKIAVWCLTWLPLAAWCYLRMLPLSDKALELAGGYDGMSADQCDVRQSILYRRGQHKETKKCICAALNKNPKKAHTRGLLHIGLAKIYQLEGDWRSAETEVRAALTEAAEAEKRDPRQAVRIYRHCANITDFIEQGDPIPGNQLRQKAKELSKTINAQDQLLKTTL